MSADRPFEKPTDLPEYQRVGLRVMRWTARALFFCGWALNRASHWLDAYSHSLEWDLEHRR